MKNVFKYLNILFILFALYNCDDMNQTHEQYLNDGLKIYLNKAVGAQVKSGDERVEIVIPKNFDNRIDDYIVYYNNNEDSLIAKNADDVNVLIDPMPEGTYAFNIISRNEKYTSLPLEIVGNSYGEIYKGQLINRKMTKKVVNGSTYTIAWKKLDDSYGMEINYTNSDSVELTKTFLQPFISTVLDSVNANFDINYRTIYQPDTNCLDLFYTDFKVLE
jgi:hypothetical protein